jgi:hypothetical protein
LGKAGDRRKLFLSPLTKTGSREWGVGSREGERKYLTPSLIFYRFMLGNLRCNKLFI